MKLARELYQKIACEKAMIKEGILAHLIQTLMPFWRKEVKKSSIRVQERKFEFQNESSILWSLSHSVFTSILQTGMPVVRQFATSSDFDNLWEPLAQAFDDFLLKVSKN